VREDVDHHLGIDEGSDDLQAPATARAAFDVELEYAFEPSRPNSCARALRRVRSGRVDTPSLSTPSAARTTVALGGADAECAAKR